MTPKGRRSRALVTEAGEVRVWRAYYYCATCAAGRYPLDERWALTGSVYSPGLQRQMVWAAARGTYAEASEMFTRLGQRTIPPTSIWAVTQAVGADWVNRAAQAQAATPPERVELPPAGQDHAVPKAVSLDGGMVHIRQEGWKEFKTGVVADLRAATEPEPLDTQTETVEAADGPHLVNPTYRAVLGDVDTFSPALWALAVEAQVPTAATVVVTADGADWIWNLADDLFPEAAQVVDWYHATEYLARAAQAHFPTDAHAATHWAQTHREALFLGHTHILVTALETAGLPTQADYFRRHTRRMQYQTFREDGYPIGSGAVESGIKQFKQRVAGPGMRWSRPGLERMLLLRAALLSHTFEAQWSLN